jgi:hypothetical protein
MVILVSFVFRWSLKLEPVQVGAEPDLAREPVAIAGPDELQ